MVLKGRRVWVAGHSGMVGSAICRRLAREECNFLWAEFPEVDLRRPPDVDKWVAENRPEFVFVAAATVGGINANNTRQAEFIYDNLMIEANVIQAAYKNGVAKLLFLGSSCIYPREAPQPMNEDALLTGPLEPTNQWYAIAKIAGIKLCEAYRLQYGCNFISAMPTNLYGFGDNFHLQYSHVLPALIAKMHIAKMEERREVGLWGTGQPRREFLNVDDCADALVFLMKTYDGQQHVNIGTGTDLTVAELAGLIARVVGFEGAIRYDSSMPDGPVQKLLDVSMINALGWRARVGLEDGIRATYEWYRREVARNNVRA